MPEERFPCRIVICRDISYTDGLEIQKKYLSELKKDPSAQDVVIFCEHTPVLTLGRSGDGKYLLSSIEEILDDGIEYLEVPRGGDITYHGTGQWTVYPILRMERFGKDLHKYMRLLEDGVMHFLKGYGIESGRRAGLTGVWVGREKICAIGVAVSRWISWHGFALNIQPDLELFKKHIVPCGIDPSEGGVTSLSNITGSRYDMVELVEPVLNGVFEVLPYYYSIKEFI